MPRVTVAVHASEDLIRGANHVHVLLGKADHFGTYTEPDWQDGEGNLYCVSSGPWSDTQIAGVTNPEAFGEVTTEIQLQYPDLDLEAVAQAQAAFGFGGTAQPGRIVAVIDDDPQEALAILGLTAVPSDLEVTDASD